MNELTTNKPVTMEQYVEDTMDIISKKVAERGITIPQNYAIANGLQAAMLAIQQAVDSDGKPALSVCSPESVKQFLLNVVQNGLYLNKAHGYPVVFGNKLTLLTSYMGEVWKAKNNDTTIKNIYAEVVYEKDVFSYSIKHGHKIVATHDQNPDNINPAQIKGAYATVVYKDGDEVSEYMTIDQIKKSWSFGQTKGNSKAHTQSTEEMCKKTVIRRLAKMINAINNDSLFEEKLEEIEETIDAKENSEIIDITPEDIDSVDSVRHSSDVLSADDGGNVVTDSDGISWGISVEGIKAFEL